MLRNFDIVHIHDPELLIAAAVATLFGRKVVFDIHEYYREKIHDTFWIHPSLRAPFSQIYSLVESCVLPLLAGLVVVTDDMLARYQRKFDPDRIALVRNFPNVSREQIREAGSKPPPLPGQYVIHTGGVRKDRSFHTMVEAAERLRDMGVYAPIVNLGPVDLTGYTNHEKGTLLERAKELGVQLLGVVSFADALHWVAHAAVGYMPLARTEDNARGLPNKLFEYFLFGKPVIACDFGNAKLILERTQAGLLVNPDSPAEHASAIARLLKDTVLHERMSKAALRAADTYSFAAEFSELERLYRTILNSRMRAIKTQ
jgi:glycosyltransferase involved in cell wall biosynthesis